MTEIPTTPMPASDPFLDWLNTGTTKRRSVPMFGDQTALAEVKPIWAKIEEKKAKLEPSEDGKPTLQRAVGERSAERAIKAEMEELSKQAEPFEQRLEKSRSVWNLRALRHDEVEAIEADNPLPYMPTPNEEQSTTDKGKARFEQIARKWQADTLAVKRTRLLTQIATSIESVETPGGVTPQVSVDSLEKMLAGPFGRARIDLLDHTLTQLMTLEEAPERPFSSSNSGSTPE